MLHIIANIYFILFCKWFHYFIASIRTYTHLHMVYGNCSGIEAESCLKLSYANLNEHNQMVLNVLQADHNNISTRKFNSQSHCCDSNQIRIEFYIKYTNTCSHIERTKSIPMLSPSGYTVSLNNILVVSVQI